MKCASNFFHFKKAAKQKVDDDWSVDDAMLSVKRSKKNEEREERRDRAALIRGLWPLHNFLNFTFNELDMFKFCDVIDLSA